MIHNDHSAHFGHPNKSTKIASPGGNVVKICVTSLSSACSHCFERCFHKFSLSRQRASIHNFGIHKYANLRRAHFRMSKHRQIYSARIMNPFRNADDGGRRTVARKIICTGSLKMQGKFAMQTFRASEMNFFYRQHVSIEILEFVPSFSSASEKFTKHFSLRKFPQV